MELYNTYTNKQKGNCNETYQIGDQSGKEPFVAKVDANPQPRRIQISEARWTDRFFGG